MKHAFITAMAFIAISTTSCKKDTPTGTTPRKVQFVLYTDKDFSTNNDSISFRLSIESSGNHTLWDSVLPSMEIKNIPAFANKLVFEKTIPNNDTSLLRTGFYYSIKNIGNSWYLDTFKLGAPIKVIDFNFQ